VAALPDDELRRLYDLATELGMTPMVEVHTPQEAARAATLDARVIGVNARNLKTLEVDRAIFGTLLGELPENAVKVAESGILCVDDAVEAHECGADAVLVGEMLVRHGEPAQVLREIHRATV
ncbi:MAG: indole-3-glycerol-phosphate synthase TrpC, partial [Cutibacterium avidum]|nr:indole-3-glycerol-phosphate synthase TrpC [Cutibacterium avidum]